MADKVLPNGIKATYAYDAVDRVTSISYVGPNNTVVDFVGYSYDAVGQRISKTEGQAAPADTEFTATYDEANRLATIAIAGELFTLAYDNNGNLISKSGAASGTTTFTWNARDQLIAISSPSGSAAYQYDPLGRRIDKAVNGQRTGYVYDGMQAIAELRGGGVDAIYHTGVAIDEVLARYGSIGNRTLLQDALMSVLAQTADSGAIENFYAYSAYGEVAILGPDGDNTLQYTGRENDGMGFYYYRARYYAPEFKRFVSEDPIGLNGGVNLYAYAAGAPTSYNDPMGTNPAAKAIANAVCGGVEGGADSIEQEMKNAATRARDVYEQNERLYAEAHAKGIQNCIEAYQFHKDQCKLEECIKGVSALYKQNRDANWDWYYRFLTSGPTPAQNVVSAAKGACQIIQMFIR